MDNQTTLADFDFSLPEALIAQSPARPRDHARLLVYRRSDRSLVDDYFYNVTRYLPHNTTLVINDSKVEKCRLRFGATELFITHTANPTDITTMVRPGRKFKQGATVILDEALGLHCTVLSILEDGQRILKLSQPIDAESWNAFRLTPLPPYIKQDESLAAEYQTVYADPLGSKAAPTAGLHFTAPLLEKIEEQYPVARITLHVGLGTFAPVKDTISKHVMHSEWYAIDQVAAGLLSQAQHITAVGTTSVRTLESAQWSSNGISPQSANTAIFIKPGYAFKHVQSLITNFHLPKSTLLLLVAAFMGDVNELHRVYEHAIQQKYRFYSFGDAMLIL